MSVWRVIITDSELETGVAPACDQPDVHAMNAPVGQDTSVMDSWVHDCCPGPHIECFTEKAAGLIARALTEVEAEICS